MNYSNDIIVSSDEKFYEGIMASLSLSLITEPKRARCSCQLKPPTQDPQTVPSVVHYQRTGSTIKVHQVYNPHPSGDTTNIVEMHPFLQGHRSSMHMLNNHVNGEQFNSHETRSQYTWNLGHINEQPTLF